MYVGGKGGVHFLTDRYILYKKQIHRPIIKNILKTYSALIW